MSGVQIPSLATGLVVAKWAGLTAHTMLVCAQRDICACCFGGCCWLPECVAGLVLVDIAGAIRWGRAWRRFFERPNLAGRSIPGGPDAQGLRGALSRMAKRWETASGENFTQLGLVLSLRGIFTFGMKRQ